MLVSSPNGAYFIPAQGYIRPANVPTNVMGLVLVNYYDGEGRETRTRVPITLLGNGTPSGQQPVPQSCDGTVAADDSDAAVPLPGTGVRTSGPQTAALPPPPSPRPCWSATAAAAATRSGLRCHPLPTPSSVAS
jgi:hypothetical protein